jgi:dihydroxyacetone kinase
MKKIINSSEMLVKEMCNGLVLAYPTLMFNEKYKFIRKREIDRNKVTLISGGGSGHEPAHAGYIGKGMLDLAVVGDMFASPSQIQVYKSIKDSSTDKGTLLIIKNYSGDNMNFKNAMGLAIDDGCKVDYVIVDDDVAVQDSLYTVGRRGVAGTVFVHKISGAAAEAGEDLASVKRIAEKVIKNVKTLGFALTSCTLPAKGSPTFILADDEMEYGVGIHGEPGIRRQKIKTADELVADMIPHLLDELKLDGEEIAIIVNGFGATPLQELYVLNNSVLNFLDDKGIKVAREYVGNYMTAIDMAGASITLLKLDDELKKYLTASVVTPGLTLTGEEKDLDFNRLIIKDEQIKADFNVETDSVFATVVDEKLIRDNFIYLLDKMAAVVIENEVAFCELDSFAGDGDFGMSISKGFKQLKREWHDILNNTDTLSDFIKESSMILMEFCGGASGPIWGSAFRAAGKYLIGKEEITTVEFAEMLQASVDAIQETGKRSFGRGAVVGDKTLIDALVPCADSWAANAKAGKSYKECFVAGAEAAMAGAKATEKIVARMGRAGTVGERSIGYPDAGAQGLSVIFTEIAKEIK